MRPDDLPRLRARHSARADREALDAAYRVEGVIILAGLALALLAVAAHTGALRWCFDALRAVLL